MIHWVWLKQGTPLGGLMFNINIIAEPGIQKDFPQESLSFIKEKKDIDRLSSVYSSSDSKNMKWPIYFVYAWSILVITIFLILGMDLNANKFSPNFVLNQVIDLIIESEYMKELHLSEAQFSSDNVKVTMSSDRLQSLQNFTLGFRKEDGIPYELFQKNNFSYVSLNFPWMTFRESGSLKQLHQLATKTVFSNKIIINETGKDFELRGRSSDIISYLLQMAESGAIQHFTFSVYHLDSGQFYLKITTDRT